MKGCCTTLKCNSQKKQDVEIMSLQQIHSNFSFYFTGSSSFYVLFIFWFRVSYSQRGIEYIFEFKSYFCTQKNENFLFFFKKRNRLQPIKISEKIDIFLISYSISMYILFVSILLLVAHFLFEAGNTHFSAL